MADIIDLIYADHDWFRRQFFLLDESKTPEELGAVWDVLSTRLDTHAEAEETVFYPALLTHGGDDVPGNPEGDPEDETDDAVGDHNKIRDAVREAGKHEVGSEKWFAAVNDARTENGEHLDEEEREAMPDFIKSASLELRHELALKWLKFYAEHQAGKGISGDDVDPGAYIEAHT